MPEDEDDDLDELEQRARAIAKRRTANVLLGVVVVLLLADIVVPDQQFHIDPLTFGLVMTALLLFNDISVPWSRP